MPRPRAERLTSRAASGTTASATRVRARWRVRYRNVRLSKRSSTVERSVWHASAVHCGADSETAPRAMGRTLAGSRSLWNNRVSDQGARALAGALPQCTSLLTLKCATGRGVWRAPAWADLAGPTRAGRGGSRGQRGGLGGVAAFGITASAKWVHVRWQMRCRGVRHFSSSSARQTAQPRARR